MMGWKQYIEGDGMLRAMAKSKASMDANDAKVAAPCQVHEKHEWNYTRGALTDLVYWKCDCGAGVTDRERSRLRQANEAPRQDEERNARH